jgi:hypothetical protein
VLWRIESWRDAVELQHGRLTSGGKRHREDLHFYVIAVDNLVDAVKVIRKRYPGLKNVRSLIDQALHRFSAAISDLDDLRDLLEHFDAYDHMIGNLQKSDQLPKERMGQAERVEMRVGDAELSIFGKAHCRKRDNSSSPPARGRRACVVEPLTGISPAPASGAGWFRASPQALDPSALGSTHGRFHPGPRPVDSGPKNPLAAWLRGHRTGHPPCRRRRHE